MSRSPFEKIMILGAGIGRNLGDAGCALVASVTTQHVVKSNNAVTFPIRCAALLDAILSANKHIKL